jgi:uncharacterized protein
MKLDLSEIARTVGARASYDFRETVPDDEEIRFRGPLTGTLTVTNAGQMLLLQGKLTGEVELTCGRCLEPFTWSVEAALDEQFALELAAGPHPDPKVQDDEPAAPVFVGRSLDLDLTELLRQNVLVAMPIKPLCRSDCAGLCPVCGADRNQGDCGHAPEQLESPFSALSALLKKKEE